MKVSLFPFQKKALSELRSEIIEANGSYKRTKKPQVISYTAPTGAGKTVIMASLFESILFGDEIYPESPDSIIVWLSDSPELNEQSKLKIDLMSDKIKLSQCIVINESSFDKEILDDGHIFFLNTQKLGKNSNLVKQGDGRIYTIWETLANTVREKSDRLYFVIDEAHRGMQGKEAVKATTIMQKFLKGSEEDGLPSMPVVIGMTATPERFNNLVSETFSTIRRVITSADEVRTSGLLKDRIIITYPEETNNEMAVLKAATENWRLMWDHWHQYCFEQHYAYVNPIFVVQVMNGNSSTISETNLDECLKVIEDVSGFKFVEGEVVQTFGQGVQSIIMNGLNVQYIEPSRISDDKKVKVVFFKENLSTGWDCPRAETMMSFRHANDDTYIAQLLGRMIRTPMQMRVQVDDVLNEVHLFLPYFNSETVKGIVEELQNSEGGQLPVQIEDEALGRKKYDTLTVKGRTDSGGWSSPNKSHVETTLGGTQDFDDDSKDADYVFKPARQNGITGKNIEAPKSQGDQNLSREDQKGNHNLQHTPHPELGKQEAAQGYDDEIDREEIVKFINESGLLSYNVRTAVISNYLKSMFDLAGLITRSGLSSGLLNSVRQEVVSLIESSVKKKIDGGRYNELADKIKQFKMKSEIFDAFGKSEQSSILDYYSTTDADIERQFNLAEAKLNREGIGNLYLKKHCEEKELNDLKIDVIMFTNDDESMQGLMDYSKNKFHEINDEYRRRIPKLDDKFRTAYGKIVSDGDLVSEHNFELPETIRIEHQIGGTEYTNHLFLDETGKSTFKLNNWEARVIEEESKREDFVCWFRNPPRKPWALCIPYEMNGEVKATYPDFIIIRKTDDYIIDILEPHDPTRIDNLPKAIGFAKYAQNNISVGRIQLIRLYDKGKKIRRLDMSKGEIREKVIHTASNEALDDLFDNYGIESGYYDIQPIQ